MLGLHIVFLRDALNLRLRLVIHQGVLLARFLVLCVLREKGLHLSRNIANLLLGVFLGHLQLLKSVLMNVHLPLLLEDRVLLLLQERVQVGD